jgi:hypothetical protein
MELLQRQLSSLGAAGRRLSAAAAPGPRGAAQQRRALLSSLRASQLRAAQAAAAEAGRDLDLELQQLAEALGAWAGLAEGEAGADSWLLCTADAAGYAARDADMQELISRGMSLVSAAAGVAPPAGVADPSSQGADDTADAPDDDSDGCTAVVSCAAGGKAILGCAGSDAQRWRDQERRNEGLREELTRQRVAFKVAYDQHMSALAARAGAEGALAAVESLIETERHRQHGGPGAAAAAAGGPGGARMAPRGAQAAAGGAGEGAEAIAQQVGLPTSRLGPIYI